MFTYTTPSITCTLKKVDFTHVDYVRVAVKSSNESIVREIPVSDIDTVNGVVVVTLTQQETAALGAGQIGIQARIHYEDGSVQPTNKIFKKMEDALDKVVI